MALLHICLELCDKLTARLMHQETGLMVWECYGAVQL